MSPQTDLENYIQRWLWLQIDYPDVHIMRPGPRSSHTSGMNSIDKILALDHEDVKMGRGRYHSDSSTEQVRISHCNEKPHGGVKAGSQEAYYARC